jgi:hypothetical protein
LGCAGFRPLCDGQETSWVASICDDFVKMLINLICDAQYMMLSEITRHCFMMVFQRFVMNFFRYKLNGFL